jgi:hypothetical protein
MSIDAFQFDLPHGWENQTVYHFRGPSDGEREHMVMLVINRHLQHDDVVDFAKEQIDPMVSNLQGTEVMKDEEVTLDDGNPAYEFVYRWMPAEGVSIIKKYVFVIADGLGFTFSCEFSRKSLKTVGAGMLDLIESLVPGTYEEIEED